MVLWLIVKCCVLVFKNRPSVPELWFKAAYAEKKPNKINVIKNGIKSLKEKLCFILINFQRQKINMENIKAIITVNEKVNDIEITKMSNLIFSFLYSMIFLIKIGSISIPKWEGSLIIEFIRHNSFWKYCISKMFKKI